MPSLPQSADDIQPKLEFLIEQIKALQIQLKQIVASEGTPSVRAAVEELRFSADSILQAACDLQSDALARGHK